MPHVLRFNMNAISEKLTDLARVLQLPQSSPHAVVDWVQELKEKFSVPPDLSALGPTMQDLTSLAPQVLADPSAGTNPVPMTDDNIGALLQACIGCE